MEMEKPSSLESLAIELMSELPALCYLPCSLRAALVWEGTRVDRTWRGLD